MKFGTWLGLAALACAVGCSSSGKKTANQGDSKAVSEALTTGITVEHGKKLAGVIPKETAPDVAVTQDDAPLMLAPTGNDTIMSLDADNPDEDTDPVSAMLMQFEDSDEHFEADVEASGSGSDGGTADAGTTTRHYSVTFHVDDSICKNFCKGSFDGAMVAALKLKKGGITKHLRRPFKLDCRKDGAETCEADKDNAKKDAGSDNGGGGSNADAGGGGSSGSGSYKGIDSYSNGLQTFSKQSCICAKSKTMTSYCTADAAGLSDGAVGCVLDALRKDAAGSNGWAACAGSALLRAATKCMMSCSTDATTCDASAAVAAGDSCTGQKLPDAVKTVFDACDLGTGPATP